MRDEFTQGDLSCLNKDTKQTGAANVAVSWFYVTEKTRGADGRIIASPGETFTGRSTVIRSDLNIPIER